MTHSVHSYSSIILLTDSDDEIVQVPIDPPSPILVDTPSPPHDDQFIVDSDSDHDDQPLQMPPLGMDIDIAGYGQPVEDDLIEVVADSAEAGYGWEESIPHSVAYASSSTESHTSPIIFRSGVHQYSDHEEVSSSVHVFTPRDQEVTHTATVTPDYTPASPSVAGPSRPADCSDTPDTEPIPTVGTLRRSTIPVLDARPTIPSHRPFRLRPDGALMMFTPRKRVTLPARRRLHTTPDPSPSSPPPPADIHPAPAQPDTPTPVAPLPQPIIHRPRRQMHRRSEVRRWTFVEDLLAEWRLEEGAPSAHQIGPTSLPIPVTGEPVEQTIPLLIARIERQDRSLERLERGVVRTRAQMEGMGRGQRMVRQRVQTLEESQIRSESAQMELFGYIGSHQEMIDRLMTRVTTAEHQVSLFQQQMTQLAQQLHDTAAVAAFLMFLLAAATQTGMFPRVL